MTMAGVIASIALAALLFAVAIILWMRRELRGIVSDLRDGRQGVPGPFTGDVTVAVHQVLAALASDNEAIEAERSVLLQILNGIGEGLLAVDRQRRIVLANHRFAETFEVSGDLVGKALSAAVRVGGVFEAFDASLDGREATERFTIRSGLVERRIEARAFPLRSEAIAAVALFLDVTHLERLEQIRRDFISDFSHEVRTPLAGLRSAVESFDVGAEHLSVEEDQQLRRIMARQFARMERLVNDLSELSRIEAGDISLALGPVDVFALVRDLCEDFGDRAAQRAMRLVLTGEPIHVSADALRIQQAIGNLIDNAVKYGGERNTIDIDVRGINDFAVIKITDHGEGVAPEDRERIFRRFFRVDKSRSLEAGGSGLGLSITKHLVLLHRGFIEVSGAAGTGTTFIVRLPLPSSTGEDEQRE